MKNEILLREDHGEVVVLILNRPRMMNAFNMPMLDTMKCETELLRNRSEVRAVIITGAGEKAFCAGADLEERATLSEEKVKESVGRIREVFDSVESLNKPVIAGINGIALGGGTELALACDIRIASTDSVMGLTETRLGVIPGAGGTQRLPRLIGRGRAKEMIFTGRRISAQEALAMGLVNRVCAKGDLLDECMKTARMICEGAPLAVEQAKYVIDSGLDVDLRNGLRLEAEAYQKIIPTADRREGLAAFLDKRKPEFKGR